MKLYFSAASPFVRKVRVSAIELDLDQRIELVPTTLSPVNPNADLRKHNPLGKIPALLTDTGETLYDSPVICEYLDALAGGGQLWPVSGTARWHALRRQALADGLIDAVVLVRYEQTVRPQELRWSEWIDGQWLKVHTALDALEAQSLQGPFDIGAIAVACALGYLDLRFPDERWRDKRPQLAAWFAGVSARASLTATRPA